MFFNNIIINFIKKILVKFKYFIKKIKKSFLTFNKVIYTF